MNKSDFSFKYSLTRSEFNAWHKDLCKMVSDEGTSLKEKILSLKSLIYVIFCLAVFMLMKDAENYNGLAYLILGSIFTGALITNSLHSLQCRLQPDEIGCTLREGEFIFSNDGLLTKTEVSETFLMWSSFMRFTESDTAFSLFIDKPMAVVIPKRVFQSEDEMNQWVKFVSSHLVQKC